MAASKKPKPGQQDKHQLDPDKARLIVAEMQRRAALREPPYLKDTHAHQRAFLDDKSQFKVALCGRRSGKTTMVKRGLIQRMGYYPTTTHAYMGLTRDSAKRLLWNPMRRLAKKYNLPIRFNKVELTAYHENGSELWILGADKEEDVEKARGPAYKTFAIDEAASYRAFIRYLVREAVEPALGDHRGQLWLTGTPGRVPAGYFFDASTGKIPKFSIHEWDVRDNPYFQDPEGWLAEIREENGWSVDHPIYVREYLGKWVKDSSALVYKYDEEKHWVPELPTLPEGERWHLVLALDFGVVDPTAFVVLAYSDHDPTVYIIEAYKLYDLSPSSAAEEVRLLMDRYYDWNPNPRRGDPFEVIIGDTGGMGKAHAKEFEERHEIYVEPAEKSQKFAFIDHMNGDLQSNPPRIMLVGERSRALSEEWSILPWVEKEGRLRDRYNDRAYDDHCSDAALYGWRDCRGFRATERPKVIEEGSEEWFLKQERELLEEDRKWHEEQKRLLPWERDPTY